MHEVLPVAMLRFDPKNPRIGAPNAAQRECLALLYKRLDMTGSEKKLYNLTRDIAARGLSPADIPIVVREADGRLTVVEGNRRLAAIKILTNAACLNEIAKPSALARYTKLAREAAHRPPTELLCAVFEDRDEADHWVRAKHTGERKGAGTVTWDAIEKRRYGRSRGEPQPALDLLEALAKLPDASEDVVKGIQSGEFPITNWERLLDDADVLRRLELDETTYEPKNEALQPVLLRILDDMAKKRVKARSSKKKAGEHSLYDANDRRAYLDYVLAKSSGSVSSTPDTPRTSQQTMASSTSASPGASSQDAQGSAPSSPGSPGAAQPASSPASNDESFKNRSKLIPASQVPRRMGETDRIWAIANELSRLPISNGRGYTNAAGALLRILIELSTEDYLQREGVSVHGMAKLRVKMDRAIQQLSRNNDFDSHDAKPVRRAIEKGTFMASSPDTLNGYIHHFRISPRREDLIQAWTEIEHYLEALWKDRQ